MSNCSASNLLLENKNFARLTERTKQFSILDTIAVTGAKHSIQCFLTVLRCVCFYIHPDK